MIRDSQCSLGRMDVSLSRWLNLSSNQGVPERSSHDMRMFCVQPFVYMCLNISERFQILPAVRTFFRVVVR